jgi:hypothetical protein
MDVAVYRAPVVAAKSGSAIERKERCLEPDIGSMDDEVGELFGRAR